MLLVVAKTAEIKHESAGTLACLHNKVVQQAYNEDENCPEAATQEDKAAGLIPVLGRC
jgi:hypothetical protein